MTTRTVQFPRKEDGKENSYTYEVKSDSVISNLNFDVGAMHFYNETATAANVALASRSVGTYEVEKDDGSKVTYNKSDVYDNSTTRTNKIMDGTAVQSALFGVGDYGVKITDFKVAVTYTDEDGQEATRLDAQNALKLAGVQQADEFDPTTKGSATVFKSSTLANTNSDTTLSSMGLFSGAADDGSDLITFKWGEGEADSITVSASTTLAGLQSALRSEGKSLDLTIVQGTTATTDYNLTDADGQNVKYVGGTNDGQNYTVTSQTTLTSADLYFVSKTGVALNRDNFQITATDSTGEITRNMDATKVNALKDSTPIRYKEATAEAEETSTEPLTIAPSKALTFHIGGEQDFAIDVTIDKMTVDNLFAERDDKGNISKSAVFVGIAVSGTKEIITIAHFGDTPAQTYLVKQ